MHRLSRIVPAPARRLVAALLWSSLALPALAAPEGGQIFKCTDGSGHVTYQNEPCPKDAKAGRVDIFDNRWTADRAEKEAEWRRNASERRLATGMPARWVREALGEPGEIRDTPIAGAAQLWLYSLADRSIQVGMLNEQVLWFRETPVASPSARAPPPAEPASSASPARAAASSTRAAAPPERPADLPVLRLVPPAAERVPIDASRTAAETRPAANESRPAEPAAPRPPETGRVAADSTRAAEAAPVGSPPAKTTAQSVARGQDCRQVLSDLGPPDRQRDVPPFDAGSDPATEYFYESAAAANAGRLRIVCSNGKVEGVDRSVTR